MFKGILFDFDGTLADTMEDHFCAWQNALSEHGIAIKGTDYYPLEGMQLHEIAAELAKGLQWGRNEIDQLVQRKKHFYSGKQSVRFYPGVESLIAELKKQKVAIGIVTAGHFDQLCQSVPSWFLEKFDALVTGDQVLKGKPYPEPYSKGIKTLGLSSSECMAVENAPTGIQSAKRAGLYCVAICSTMDASALTDADEILESFDRFRAWWSNGK